MSSDVAVYIRVSSKTQDLATQQHAIGHRLANVPRIPRVYEEKASARTTDRPELKRLLSDVRAGVIRELYVFKLDRLARSGVGDTFRIVDELRRHGVTLHAIADNLTIHPAKDDIVSETLIFALSLAARLERTAINDRIAAARERMASAGEPWGRPRRVTPGQLQTARRMREEGRTAREIAAALGIPRSTIARALKAA